MMLEKDSQIPDGGVIYGQNENILEGVPSIHLLTSEHGVAWEMVVDLGLTPNLPSL